MGDAPGRLSRQNALVPRSPDREGRTLKGFAPTAETADRAWRDQTGTAALLGAVFASAAEGIVVQDGAGRVVLANPSAERILGLSADELMGRTGTDPGWVVTREDGTPVGPAEQPAAITLRTGVPQTDVVFSVRFGNRLPMWLS